MAAGELAAQARLARRRGCIQADETPIGVTVAIMPANLVIGLDERRLPILMEEAV
jgi:hypothetical protein